ncbi:trypsin-like serine protease [Rhizobium sp. 3T7]|uniref:trypsin-like serine protease n=1 Tax=Rhizobium sp. 3T7 TaxID=2874922 RepID=UPI001CCC382C|nr:trypsin-like serine protease [Rhizobium sp. 3T7]MBZ9791704.1 trypsin-like serine protease [Rhizobium sp. 3T7]
MFRAAVQSVVIAILVAICSPAWSEILDYTDSTLSPETKFSSGIIHIQIGGNYCSGSVIGRRTILTAEHCFRTQRNGSGLPVTFMSKSGRQVILSEDLVTYPRPDPDKCCDLALLTLSKDVPAGTTVFGFSDELFSRYQKYVAPSKTMGESWKAADKFSDLLDHDRWPDPMMKTEAILFETYGRGSYGQNVGQAVNGGLKSCSLRNPDKSLVLKRNNTGYFGMHLPWVWSLRTSAACAGNSGGPSFFLRKGRPYEEKGKIIIAGVNSVGLGPQSVYSEPAYRWLKSQGF